MSGFFGRLVPFDSCCRVGPEYDSEDELDVQGKYGDGDPWNYDVNRQASDPDAVWVLPEQNGRAGSPVQSHQPLPQMTSRTLQPGTPTGSWQPPLQQGSWQPPLSHASYQPTLSYAGPPAQQRSPVTWGGPGQGYALADAYKSSYAPPAGPWQYRRP